MGRARENNSFIQPEPVRENSSQPGIPIASALSLSGIDGRDITLGIVLFLLYLQTKDEDFLIILGIIAFSIFKNRGR